MTAALGKPSAGQREMHALTGSQLTFAAWIVALVATSGALFIGEVMGQAPCVLCWYQRVFMFPLSVVLAIAYLRSDANVWRYALPLAVLGWLVACYHNLIYFGLVTEKLVPCTSSGPSCSTSDMTILGGVPIPLLSVAAFSAIAAFLSLIPWRHVR